MADLGRTCVLPFAVSALSCVLVGIVLLLVGIILLLVVRMRRRIDELQMQASAQCPDPFKLEANQNQRNASFSSPHIIDNSEPFTKFNVTDMDRILDRLPKGPDNSQRTSTPSPNSIQVGTSSRHFQSPTPFRTHTPRGAMSCLNSAEGYDMSSIVSRYGPTGPCGDIDNHFNGCTEDTQQLNSMGLNIELDLRSYGPDEAAPGSIQDIQEVRKQIEYASQHEPEDKNHWKTVMNMFDAVDQQIARLPFIAGMMLSNEQLEIHIRPNSECDAQSCCNRIRNLMPPGKEHLLLIEEEPASMMTGEEQPSDSVPQMVKSSDRSSDEVRRTPTAIPTILTNGSVLVIDLSLPEDERSVICRPAHG